MALLEIRHLTKYFGGLAAVVDVSLDVEEGEIVGLIGPNGAGKTTFFNLITGYIKATSGTIRYQRRDITRLKPHVISNHGLVRTFQGTILFKQQTVLENVIMGHYLQRNCNLITSILGFSSAQRENEKIRQLAMDVLKRFGLADYSNELAGSLSLGYQRTLGVAISTSTKPKMLLLDEPISGMNAEETKHMMDLIVRINRGGTTILLVEHDMKFILKVCERIAVLNFGKKIAEGPPEAIVNNQDVIEQYLGSEERGIYAT